MQMPRVQGGTRCAVAIAALAAALGFADKAHALTDVRIVGATLLVEADPGFKNNITIFNAGTNVRVRDTNDFVFVGAGCVRLDPITAECPRAAISRAQALAGD